MSRTRTRSSTAAAIGSMNATTAPMPIPQSTAASQSVPSSPNSQSSLHTPSTATLYAAGVLSPSPVYEATRDLMYPPTTPPARRGFHHLYSKGGRIGSLTSMDVLSVAGSDADEHYTPPPTGDVLPFSGHTAASATSATNLNPPRTLVVPASPPTISPLSGTAWPVAVSTSNAGKSNKPSKAKDYGTFSGERDVPAATHPDGTINATENEMLPQPTSSAETAAEDSPSSPKIFSGTVDTPEVEAHFQLEYPEKVITNYHAIRTAQNSGQFILDVYTSILIYLLVEKQLFPSDLTENYKLGKSIATAFKMLGPDIVSRIFKGLHFLFEEENPISKLEKGSNSWNVPLLDQIAKSVAEFIIVGIGSLLPFILKHFVLKKDYGYLESILLGTTGIGLGYGVRYFFARQNPLTDSVFICHYGHQKTNIVQRLGADGVELVEMFATQQLIPESVPANPTAAGLVLGRKAIKYLVTQNPYENMGGPQPMYRGPSTIGLSFGTILVCGLTAAVQKGADLSGTSLIEWTASGGGLIVAANEFMNVFNYNIARWRATGELPEPESDTNSPVSGAAAIVPAHPSMPPVSTSTITAPISTSSVRADRLPPPLATSSATPAITITVTTPKFSQSPQRFSPIARSATGTTSPAKTYGTEEAVEVRIDGSPQTPIPTSTPTKSSK